MTTTYKFTCTYCGNTWQMTFKYANPKCGSCKDKNIKCEEIKRIVFTKKIKRIKTTTKKTNTGIGETDVFSVLKLKKENCYLVALLTKSKWF